MIIKINIPQKRKLQRPALRSSPKPFTVCLQLTSSVLFSPSTYTFVFRYYFWATFLKFCVMFAKKVKIPRPQTQRLWYSTWWDTENFILASLRWFWYRCSLGCNWKKYYISCSSPCATLLCTLIFIHCFLGTNALPSRFCWWNCFYSSRLLQMFSLI